MNWPILETCKTLCDFWLWDFIPRKIPAIWHGIYESSKTKGKKADLVLQAVYSTLPRHKFVALYVSRPFVSKPHTKSSSALDYMNITCEQWKWFWFVQVKQLTVLYFCLRSSTTMTLHWNLSWQWVNNTIDPQQFTWFDLRSQQSTFARSHT